MSYTWGAACEREGAPRPGRRDGLLDYALYPHERSAKHDLAQDEGGTAESTRRVDEAARMLDIEVLLDRLPKMSGGQRQRVAMGRAIVRPPVFSAHEHSQPRC